MSKTTEKVRYEYDRQGSMLSDGKNIYGYDSFNRVEQVATADGNIIRYIRGLGIICSDSESAKTYYHYASDEQSSITHVTDAETGEVLNHYTYDAFGNTMECDEKVHNRFRHNGEQYDPLTGQYYLRARFYNPVIARFTQEDTYYGDGLNLYQYCANNPIAYVDLSGHNICQTQRDVYHEKCEAYMRDHGLTDYSQIPKNEKNRMFKEMRTELGKTSDSRYKGSGTSPEIGSANKKNKGLQNATAEEINQAKVEIGERISEIKDVMNEGEKSRTTYGVAKVKCADGSYEVWVASAGKEGYVRPAIRKNDSVKKNKTSEGNSANRFNDAEQTLMREANQNNAEILAMAASRPMCERCQEVARVNEIIDRMVTELK